jgi:hypothetical protein
MLKNHILYNVNLCSSIFNNYKLKILDKLIDDNKDLAEQGSDEWLSIRKYTIGGSEMSTITGDNPYSKLDSLVSQKIGFTKFDGNIACRWGKVFEVTTTQLTERIMNINKIHETGSLEGATNGQRYSPDGLAVVKVKCHDVINNEEIETDEYCIVLFEFKSPYSSIPTGIIPKHYLPQVLTGLCSIPITDFAIFINNVYRKCCISDLNETLAYDINFHSRDAKLEPTEVLALGVNIFYQTNAQKNKFIELYRNDDIVMNSDASISDSDDSDGDNTENIFNNINKQQFEKTYNDIPELYRYIQNIHFENQTPESVRGVRDFGTSNYYEFNDLLKLYDDDLISLHVSKPHICENYYENEYLKAQELKPDNLDNLETSIKNYKKEIKEFPNIIGYLPYKLFKSDIIVQERDPEYINKHKEKINDTINILNDINDSETDFEKIKKFKKYFPKSKILKNTGREMHDAFKFMPMGM